MQVNRQRHFSLAFVFLVPLIVPLAIIALTIKNYYDSVNGQINDEYQRIHSALSRATKVLSAIDYSFSNYSKSNFIWLVDHNRQVVDGLCQMWPIDALLRAEGRGEIPAVDINYMLVGDKVMCDPNSAQYKRVSGQVSLAPVLSFLHDIDDFLLGIHYIDREGYIMSSPDTYAKNITSEIINTIKTRPFWQVTARNRDLITISGPAPVLSYSQLVMSLSMPVFNQDVHQGMLSLDIAYNTLLSSQQRLAGELGLYNSAHRALPNDAVRIESVKIDGVAVNYTLYYQYDWKAEIRHLVDRQRYGLLLAVFTYVFSVIALFFINIRVEHNYFKQLAARDPLTGLLNRRGLEVYLATAQRENYLALAVFDIDNFKSINDTFGHDVGDQVIIYMAKKITANIRSHDAAARVGGEEFVVFMTGNEIEPLKVSMQRVQKAVRDGAQQVLSDGFTISGGVEVVSAETDSSFEVLFKAADTKLYQAKTTGKDKLVF